MLEKHEKMIAKAEKSVTAIKNQVGTDPHRMKYHFMSPAYWISDPIGLIYYKDEYHLFYQHYPYAPKWSSMHWGHAKSKDLTHWEHLPIALAPSEPYDFDERGGCFSGCAVDDDGVLSLLYTGAIIKDGELIQKQCLATSVDGIHFEKYEGNPVIPTPPEEGITDFRDTKVWKHNGIWYMVIGSSKNGRGRVLLYKSANLKEWTYIGVLAESDGTLGSVWECPDLFPLGDKYVLMFCAAGMGDRKTIYLVGDMNYKTGKFTWDFNGEIDWGFDYYSCQSFQDGKGRRILMAWLNVPDWVPWFNDYSPPFLNNWSGALAYPRTIELEADGQLKFSPVEEIKTLRKTHFTEMESVIEAGVQRLPAEVQGDCLEIIAHFDLETCSAETFGFHLRTSEDRTQKTVLSYNVQTQELQFDRTHSDGWSHGVRSVKLELKNKRVLDLRILVDTSTIETFADNGRTVMSNNIFPSNNSTIQEIFSIGGSVTLLSLDVWQLNAINK